MIEGIYIPWRNDLFLQLLGLQRGLLQPMKMRELGRRSPPPTPTSWSGQALGLGHPAFGPLPDL
jgi:hypothetical protein